MTVESCIMAALFSVSPPTSSSLLDSQGGSGSAAAAAAAAASSQEGGGALQSDEGQENSSGIGINHKSLRHHVSSMW